MLLIAPLAGTSWTRSGRGSSTPTSTAPPGILENNIVGFLLFISTLPLLLRLVLLSRRSIVCWLVFGADVGAKVRFLEYDDVFVVFSAYHRTLTLDMAINELVILNALDVFFLMVLAL